MSLTWFTAYSLAIVLVPLGQFIWSARYEPPARAALRFAATLAAGLGAFGLVGSAVVQGSGDSLLAVARERLFFRQFDTAALHHAMLVAVACGVVAAATVRGGRGSVAGVVLLAVLLGGVLLPAAMKWVWFGPLRRAGLIDVGGAVAVHAIAGVIALIAARATAGRMGRDDLPLPMGSAAHALGALVMLAGWSALLLTASVMQAPAEVSAAASNAVRAGVAGAVTAMVLARLTRQSDAAPAVVTGMVAGLVAVSAVGGRAGAAGALGIGAAAGLILPAVRRGFAASFGPRDPTVLAAAHLIGGVLGAAAATIYRNPGTPPGNQLLLQLASAAMAAAAALFVGLLLVPALRVLSSRDPDHPPSSSSVFPTASKS